MVNLQEQLDALDIFRRITGIRLQDIYNLLLKKGWTLGSGEIFKVLHVVIRVMQPAWSRVLRDFWTRKPAGDGGFVDPEFQSALCLSLEAALPGTPLVTILTDIADYPPHFWIERQEQYLICGSERAVEQARELGHRGRLHLSHVRDDSEPALLCADQADRSAERQRLGLDPELPTGLVLFGGEGSTAMREIAQAPAIDGAAPAIDFDLRHATRNWRRSCAPCARASRMFVEGFTREVPYYMHLADFFIGKPGPGSISEAIAMKLPVIVERNAWTLPQERYNSRVGEGAAGRAGAAQFPAIGRAVEELLEPGTYARMRAHAAAQTNRAVFEIPDMLEGILAKSFK